MTQLIHWGRKKKCSYKLEDLQDVILNRESKVQGSIYGRPLSVGGRISFHVCSQETATHLEAYWRNWLYWLPAEGRARQGQGDFPLSNLCTF